jgi:hypothetical protein
LRAWGRAGHKEDVVSTMEGIRTGAGARRRHKPRAQVKASPAPLPRPPLIVRAKVRRSDCGEAYVRTGRPRDESELGERIFVSDGASMLFWRNRTYRLYW